jgi:hypothetical protein
MKQSSYIKGKNYVIKEAAYVSFCTTEGYRFNALQGQRPDRKWSPLILLSYIYREYWPRE